MQISKFCYPVAIASIIFFASCGEDDTLAVGEPAIITLESIPYSVGLQENYSEIVPAEITTITQISGTDLLFDFSDLIVTENYATTPYQSFSDPELPRANYAFRSFQTNTLTGKEQEILRIMQRSESGIYNIAIDLKEEEVLPILGGAGELVFNNGYQVNQGEAPLYIFPATYETSGTFESSTMADFTITLPTAGLTDAPANTLDSTTTEIEVVAWGEVILPTSSRAYPVILQRNTYTTKRTYLIGGSPAPAELLTPIGLGQDEIRTETTYEFISPEFGVIMYLILNDGEAMSAAFKNDLPE
ncbi:MAG: hypothetical protein WBA74_23655 [Cyclobacteriaceae bacterium]